MNMNTKIYILSLLGSLLLVMSSCLSDGKEDYLDEYTSFLCILNSNEQEVTFYNTGATATYDITIDKGGYNLNMTASAVLKVLSDFDLEVYNEENLTHFKQLPEECYELPADMSVSFGEKDLYQIKTVTFYPDKFAGLEEDGSTYVLMMELTEGTSPINAKNKYVIVKPTVHQPQLSLEETGFKLPFTIMKGVTEYTYELPITLSTPLLNDLTCDVTVKQSLLDDYNTQNETDYKLMGTDYYTLGTLTIAKGSTTANLTVKVDIAGMADGNFAIPLEITSKYSFIGDHTIIIGLENSIPKIKLTAEMMKLTGTELQDGTFDDWFDGSLTTFAQVSYGGAAKKFPHQLDIHLNDAISALKIRYATRNTNQHPSEFIVYVGNDGENWTEIKKFTLADELPTALTTYYEKCPVMELGGSYTYVRFEVHNSTNPNKVTTWALSEFELYGK